MVHALSFALVSDRVLVQHPFGQSKLGRGPWLATTIERRLVGCQAQTVAGRSSTCIDRPACAQRTHSTARMGGMPLTARIDVPRNPVVCPIRTTRGPTQSEPNFVEEA